MQTHSILHPSTKLDSSRYNYIMQITRSSCLALLASSHCFLLAAANAGYIAFCDSAQLLDPSPGKDSLLTANCRQTDGIFNVDAPIGLSRCFGNSGRHLVAQLK